MSREGRFEVETVTITTLSPNRKRNFDVYPINEDVVAGLMASYEKTGDFGVIPVRESGPNRYEMACGHHRVEAMKRLGHTRVTVKIAGFSDQEMTDVMILENATQGGRNPAALADSVLAKATDIAYALFLSMNREEFESMTGVLLAEISASSVNRDKPYEYAKANAEKGKASAALICVGMGGQWKDGADSAHADKDKSPMAEDDIQSALRSLGDVDSGDGKHSILQKKIWVERDRAAQEVAATEKKERERAEQARLKAELAEKQAAYAKEQAELAEKARVKAERAKEEAAIAKAAALADQQKRRAKAQEKERQRLQAEADEKAKALAAREKQMNKSEAAKEKAEDIVTDLFLAPNLLSLFNNPAQFESYRNIVKKNAQFFPKEEQFQFVTLMLATLATSEGEHATARGIREYMSEAILKRNAKLRDEFEKSKAAEEERKLQGKLRAGAKRIHEELDYCFRRLAAAMAEFDKNANDSEFMRHFMELPPSPLLYGNMNMLEDVLPSARQKLGLAARSMTEETTVENVVN